MTSPQYTQRSLEALENYKGFKEGRAQVREQLAQDLRQHGDSRAADAQVLAAKRIRDGLE